MTALELLVLIVPDLGLRSALVGRLSLHGESLVTVSRLPAGIELDRIARSRATLIVDAEAVDGTLPAMRGDPRWERIIVLDDAAHVDSADDRCRFVDRADAVDRVSAVLESWRTPQLSFAFVPQVRAA